MLRLSPLESEQVSALQGAKRIDREIRKPRPIDVETQLYRNGGFYGGRLFELREDVLRHADELRADLRAMGWCSEAAQSAADANNVRAQTRAQQQESDAAM